MSLFQLPVVQTGISQPDINRIILLDVFVILVAFDIESSGFVEQKCFFKITDDSLFEIHCKFTINFECHQTK